jgi:hypothetical protein
MTSSIDCRPLGLLVEPNLSITEAVYGSPSPSSSEQTGSMREVSTQKSPEQTEKKSCFAELCRSDFR